ncbi:unnamed protein product [Closterium sp. NIES-54]
MPDTRSLHCRGSQRAVTMELLHRHPLTNDVQTQAFKRHASTTKHKEAIKSQEKLLSEAAKQPWINGDNLARNTEKEHVIKLLDSLLFVTKQDAPIEGDAILRAVEVFPALIVMLYEWDSSLYELATSYRFHFLLYFLADVLEQLNVLNRAFQQREVSRVSCMACDSKDGLSLFDLTSGASAAPAADADSTVRSQWLTHDAAARLAVRSHLPATKRAHFSQYKSDKTLYDAVVARYSSPATAALSRLMLPYLFPELAAFATVTDLITHLRTSDTRYRAALPAKFCAQKPLPCTSPSTT